MRRSPATRLTAKPLPAMPGLAAPAIMNDPRTGMRRVWARRHRHLPNASGIRTRTISTQCGSSHSGRQNNNSEWPQRRLSRAVRGRAASDRLKRTAGEQGCDCACIHFHRDLDISAEPKICQLDA